MAYIYQSSKRSPNKNISKYRRVSSHSDGYTFEDIEAIANHIRDLTDYTPNVAIICGSGLGGLADTLEDPVSFNYCDIPGFPLSTVQGHAGRLVFGTMQGRQVLCMQGRFHFYEGYSMFKVSLPVRVFFLLNIKYLIVTNAAGGLNPAYHVGDIMIIQDHINIAGMSGNNSLFGPNEERFGPRFPPMSNAYDPELRKIAEESAHETGMQKFLRKGVYAFVSGPGYETPSEANFLKMIGSDNVGMSTVPEVMAAHHCGIKVLGLSLVTNMVVTNINDRNVANHAEVLETTVRRAKDMEKLVKKIIAKLPNPE